MLISKTPGGYTFEMTNGEIIILWTTCGCCIILKGPSAKYNIKNISKKRNKSKKFTNDSVIINILAQ